MCLADSGGFGQAGGFHALEFFLVLEQLAGEAGFVAAEDLEGFGILFPGAGLPHHAGGAFVGFPVGFVRAHVEIQHVVFDGGDATDAEVEIDDFLGDLNFGFGFWCKVADHFLGELLVSFELVLLHDQVIAGKAVLEGAEGGALFACVCLLSHAYGVSRCFGGWRVNMSLRC